jgi:predicted TIM-barrel fold metal-dependent hydrolase
MSEPGGSIDVHAHFLPPGYRDALAEAEVWMIGGLPVPEWSPQLALEFMYAHGIATQILSISDPGVEFLAAREAPALARACNDYAAELIATHPGRFGALAVLPLSEPAAAAAEAARAIDELGLDGVGLLSSAGGHYLGDPCFEPLMRALDERDAWVFVHPTAPALRPHYAIPDSIAEYPFDTTRSIISLLFNGVFARHPAIRWHFAHGGGTLPMHRLRLSSLASNAAEFGTALGLPEGAAVLDGGSLQAAIDASFFDTALVADPSSLEAVRRLGRPGRVVFGSDWPFAARLYGDSGELQPVIEEVFGAEDARAVRRETVRAELARLR